MGDNLGVRFRNKPMAFTPQFFFEFLEILDDTVVDDQDLPVQSA